MSGPKELPRPIGRVLGGTADDAQVARMWAGVGARRGAARGARARRRVVATSMAAALAVAAGVALWVSATARPGALGARDGGPVRAWSVATGAAPRRVELDDGSAITLAPGARLETVENDGERFCVLLGSGRAHFAVRPGGPRRWVVEAGLASVEVVGTVFDVERSADGVRVSVQRGVVVVRGDGVPNHITRLEVGASLRVPAEPVAGPVAAVVPARDDAREAHDAPEAHDATGSTMPAAGGDAAALDRMMEEADQARRDGRTADALALLDHVARARDDAHAALAAFTRARIELADDATRDDGIRDLDRAVGRGLPEPLEHEARARLVDALARSGRTDEARRAAAAYLAWRPDGRFAAEMRARVDAP